MQAFEVRAERAEQQVRVRIAGEVDLATAPRVAACLDAQAPGLGEAVELDLSEVAFIDSTGVHLLVKVADEARRGGWTLTIVPSRAVGRIVSMLGLQEQLPISRAADAQASVLGVAAA